MTVAIDPVAITTLVALILAAIGGFIWFGKLSNRLTRTHFVIASVAKQSRRGTGG